jgi:DNA polymerase III subunit epsilon
MNKRTARPADAPPPPQLGFDWTDPAPTTPRAPDPLEAQEESSNFIAVDAFKISAAAVNDLENFSAPTPTSNLEPLAQQLEQHPDYRVLRRLVPTLQFGGPPPQRTLTLLILDTETTGLDASRDSVIELALIRVTLNADTGQPVGTVQVYDGFEDPGKPIPPLIVALTGITDAHVSGQRLDDAAIATLLHGVDWVIAHNARFDRPFVEARLPAFADLAWACSLDDVDWKALGRSSAKLESLAASMGWFYDAHRADMDCHALLAVLTHPLDAQGTTALRGLLVRAAQPQRLLQAQQAPFDRKDLLKNRGYRWNADSRVWQTTVSGDDALNDELAWLQAEVYGARALRLPVEEKPPTVRYANRPGTTAWVHRP